MLKFGRLAAGLSAACLLMMSGCGGEERKPQTANEWGEILQDPDQPVELRREAATQIHTLVPPGSSNWYYSIGVLLNAVQNDEDREVRMRALHSLRVMRPKEAEVIDALKEIRRGTEDYVVRHTINETIVDLGGDPESESEE